MVSITPARELTDLEAIAVLCRLAAGTAALADKPLDQQSVAPHCSTSQDGIKKTGDISKRLRLIYTVQNRRQIFANGLLMKGLTPLALVRRSDFPLSLVQAQREC